MNIVERIMVKIRVHRFKSMMVKVSSLSKELEKITWLLDTEVDPASRSREELVKIHTERGKLSLRRIILRDEIAELNCKIEGEWDWLETALRKKRLSLEKDAQL